MRVRMPTESVLLRLTAAVVFSAVIAACGPLPESGADTKPSILPAVTETIGNPALPTPTVNIATLTLWLPPAFRPDSSSAGGKALAERIEAYEARNPGVQVVVRIKAASGAGGLRDSLAVAAAAAPGALPDLVALDQSNLRAAAIKNLIHPLDGLLPSQTWDSHYAYAKNMVVIDDLRYGLPFSGDALILASTAVPYSEPERWDSLENWTAPVFLPLGDSRALFLFYGYYAAGGIQILSSTDGEILQEPFARELSWLRSMAEYELLSPRSLQIDSFEGAFLAIESIAECAATLYSVVSHNTDYFMTYLPTPDGSRFSLATGWAWTLATADPMRRIKAADLILWLTDPEFLAEWSQAQGVLPASSEAVALWPPGNERELAAGVSGPALPFPDDEISAFIGPIFSKAVRKVLVEGATPEEAAREAAESIRP
ncbi:MAG: extracellular solute-binding protein [Anaerolineales bacterium]|nr:extracellular solute-binding protein [Anaerolineales bacterium]